MEVLLRAGELLHYLLSPFECLLRVLHFVGVQCLLFNKMGTVNGLKKGPLHNYYLFVLQKGVFPWPFFLIFKERRKNIQISVISQGFNFHLYVLDSRISISSSDPFPEFLTYIKTFLSPLKY